MTITTSRSLSPSLPDSGVHPIAVRSGSWLCCRCQSMQNMVDSLFIVLFVPCPHCSVVSLLSLLSIVSFSIVILVYILPVFDSRALAIILSTSDYSLLSDPNTIPFPTLCGWAYAQPHSFSSQSEMGHRQSIMAQPSYAEAKSHPFPLLCPRVQSVLHIFPWSIAHLQTSSITTNKNAIPQQLQHFLPFLLCNKFYLMYVMYLTNHI